LGALLAWAVVRSWPIGGWYDVLLFVSIGAFEVWLLAFAIVFAVLVVSSWPNGRLMLGTEGLAPGARLSVRHTVPIRRYRLARRLLCAGGVLAICWSVSLLFLSRLDLFNVSSYVGIATGTYALSTSLSHDRRRFGMAAAVLGLSVLDGNLIGLGLGVAVMLIANRQEISVGVVPQTHDANQPGIPAIAGRETSNSALG
jgi:hypothetical protein